MSEHFCTADNTANIFIETGDDGKWNVSVENRPDEIELALAGVSYCPYCGAKLESKEAQ